VWALRAAGKPMSWREVAGQRSPDGCLLLV
jgi:hypothetical protein